MLNKAIFALIVLAQLVSVAMPNGITHLAQGLDVNQYPTFGCNTSSDQKNNRDNEDTSDGSCTGQKANQVTCAVPDEHSRVWMDLGEEIRLRTVIVIERSIPAEVHREKSDSKVVRGCPASVGAGTDGDNFDSADCFACGDQSGLPANQAITCDMTVQHLFVYLLQDDEILQLNEIMAFEEVTIGHDNDPSSTTATVTVMPEPYEGRAGAQLWRDMMILYANDSESAPYMAMAEPGATAADTYVTISFESTEDSSERKIHIGRVLIFGNLQNASETPINPNYAIYAYTAVSSTNETPAYVQCGADIESTCSERACEMYSTGLKVEKTVDLSQIYVGGIIVFECNITDFSSTEPDDDLYVQGDDAQTTTVEYNLEAECTEDEYDEFIEWTYTVLKDDVEVESYSELTFDRNTCTVEIDEEYTDDELYEEFTYTVTIHGEIQNSYGLNEFEETFDIEIKDYCYDKGDDGTLNDVDDFTHDIYKATTDYDIYTGPYGVIDADYAQCYTVVASNDCSSLGTIAVDIEDGHVTVDRVTDPSNTGTCTVTLSLQTLDSNVEGGKGTEMDSITFDITYEYNCDITVAYDDFPIEYTLSSGDQTTDLEYSIENTYCPDPTGYTFTCGDEQAFCDRALSLDATTGIITINDDIEDDAYASSPISFTINWNPDVLNTVDIAGSYTFKDPCIESATEPDTDTAFEVDADGTSQTITNYVWTYTDDPTACDVAPTYILQRTDYDEETEINPLTDYLTYNAATNVITYDGSFPEGEVGYEFSITLNFTANFDGWFNELVEETTITIDITKPGPQGPVFVTEPDLGSFESAGAYSYTLPAISNTSGATTNTYTVDVGAATWLIWDLSTTTFTVAPGAYVNTGTTADIFQVTITLSDELDYENVYNKAITVNAPASQANDNANDNANNNNGGDRGPPPRSDFEGVVIPEEEIVEETEPVFLEPEIVPVTEEEEANPVEVSDANVDKEGILEMDFTKDVVVPEETARRLSEDGHFDLTDYSNIFVVGGSPDSAEEYALSIKPMLTRFDSKRIEINLQFRRPLDVSVGSEPDYAVFTLTDNSIFTDAESGKPIDFFEKKMYLPKLVDTNNPEDVLYMKELEKNGETAGTYFGIIIVLTLIVSLTLATSLKGLWMFIHFAQVVAYLKYYSPNLPANMATIFSLLDSTINLSFLGFNGIFGNWDTWANEKFGMEDEAAAIKGLGKDGASISMNIGLYLFAYLILFISIAIYLVLKQIVERSRFLKPTISKFVSFLEDKLFFNAFLRTMILGCLSFDHLICVFFLLQMRASDENKSGALVTFCVIFMIVMAAIPPVLGFVLKKYRNKLENKSIKQKFGALYYGVRTTHTCTIVYTAVFMLRRMILVLVAVYGQNLRHWLALAFVVQQLFYLVYLTAVRPQYQPFENFVEIFNEVTTLVFGYFMIFTTDFVPEVSTQYHYGWIVSQIIMTVMILNLVYMIFAVVYEGFYQKRHQLKLHSLNKRREAKIDQIKNSADQVTRTRMTDNELRTLMKLRFTKRGQDSSVTAEGLKDYTQSATYKQLGLFDERRNQVANQSPTKKSLKGNDDLSLEIDDSKTQMHPSYVQRDVTPQNLTVVYEEDDHEQLENSFRSNSDVSAMSLMFDRTAEMPVSPRQENNEQDYDYVQQIDTVDAKAVQKSTINRSMDNNNEEDLDFYPQSHQTINNDINDGTQIDANVVSQGSSGNINFNVVDVLDQNTVNFDQNRDSTVPLNKE